MRFQGSEIADQPVAISSCGTHNVDPSPYLVDFGGAETGSNSVVCIISHSGSSVIDHVKFLLQFLHDISE